MKNLVLLMAMLLSLTTTRAQDEKLTQDLKPFSEIKAFDGIYVKLIKSNENKAVITGTNTDKVAIVNNDGVLKIRMTFTKMFSGYRTFVTVHFTDKLIVLDVNEDARITCEEPIVQDVIELKAQEGGEIQVYTEVEQLLVKTVTGGVINTSGRADLQDVQVNTGGIYEGKDLKTKFSTINVNAGSKAEIHALDYVKATVKAGGVVLVYGDPAKMDEKTVFGGKITRM